MLVGYGSERSGGRGMKGLKRSGADGLEGRGSGTVDDGWAGYLSVMVGG